MSLSFGVKIGEREVVVDSSEISTTVVDFASKASGKIAELVTPSQPFDVDEMADLTASRFDSKEVKFYKAQAAHWKQEAQNWRGIASDIHHGYDADLPF